MHTPDGLLAIFLIFCKFNMVKIPQIVARFLSLFRLIGIKNRFPYLSSKGFVQSNKTGTGVREGERKVKLRLFYKVYFTDWEQSMRTHTLACMIEDSILKYEHLVLKTWGGWSKSTSFSAVKMVALIASFTAELSLDLHDK